MASTISVARPHTGPGTPATKATREERLDAAHQLLAAGVAELITSDAWKRMLTVAARFHHYRGGTLGVFRRPESGLRGVPT